MKKIYFIFSIVLLSFLILKCDGGIEPEPLNTHAGETGFSGKITFVGNWPQNVKRTHLVVFKELIQDTSDFFPPNLTFVVDSVEYGSTEFAYNSIDNNFIPLFNITPGTYKYVVVAQSNTPELSLRRADWTVVGVYTTTGDQSQPGVLNIEEGELTEDINITVDFNNPPLQPPGG
jgi:hypothetical protein